MMIVKDMDELYAKEVIMWNYEEPYDFYNSEIGEAALMELLNDSYFVVVDEENRVIGYFCIGDSAQVPIGTLFGAYPHGYVDVGIGLKPELTGKGLGHGFFSFILEYIAGYFGPAAFRLTVALFNSRAIHLYEQLGFKKMVEFQSGETAFMTMVRE